MSKRVVTDGNTTTAKKQRIIEEEQKAMDDKVDFSLDFTVSEEKAWIHEEKCNTIILVVSIVTAIIMGIVTAFICKILEPGSTAAIVDTVLIFLVAALLKKISSPFVKRYVAKNFDPAYAEMAGTDMLAGRNIAMAIFMYLVMALGSCVVVLSLLIGAPVA